MSRSASRAASRATGGEGDQYVLINEKKFFFLNENLDTVPES
jgi:hypothetical protein